MALGVWLQNVEIAKCGGGGRWSRGDNEEEKVETKNGPVGGDDEGGGNQGGDHSKSLMQVSRTRGRRRRRKLQDVLELQIEKSLYQSNLLDPASSHMLV